MNKFPQNFRPLSQFSKVFFRQNHNRPELIKYIGKEKIRHEKEEMIKKRKELEDEMRFYKISGILLLGGLFWCAYEYGQANKYGYDS